MGFDKQEAEAIQHVVRGVIERTIASLQGIGMTHDGACHLMIIQGAIRLSDDAELKRLVEDYQDRQSGRA